MSASLAWKRGYDNMRVARVEIILVYINILAQIHYEINLLQRRFSGFCNIISERFAAVDLEHRIGNLLIIA
ncbi:hypothetical protein D3C78_1397300 [compost metagenome]